MAEESVVDESGVDVASSSLSAILAAMTGVASPASPVAVGVFVGFGVTVAFVVGDGVGVDAGSVLCA